MVILSGSSTLFENSEPQTETKVDHSQVFICYSRPTAGLKNIRSIRCGKHDLMLSNTQLVFMNELHFHYWQQLAELQSLESFTPLCICLFKIHAFE